MRWLLPSLLVGLGMAECERAPAEDFPRPGVAQAASSGASVGQGRPASERAATSTAPADEAPPTDEAAPAARAAPAEKTPGAGEGARALDLAERPADEPSGRCVALTPSAPPPPVPHGPAANCPGDPEPNPGALTVGRVSFLDVSGVAVDAEIVRTERDTMRGLMYRKALGESRGMLFDLRVRDDHKFWMHNTCIPLDMIFIDEDGLIVGLVENVPTMNDASRGVGCPSRWVLEVNAGWSRRHGVRAGQRLSLP